MQVLLILYSWRLERRGQRCHMCAFLVRGRPAASRGRRWSPPQCAVEQSDVRKGEKARCGGRRRLSLEEVNNNHNITMTTQAGVFMRTARASILAGAAFNNKRASSGLLVPAARRAETGIPMRRESKTRA